MSASNIRQFVEQLRSRGQLREIVVPVDPHLEIAEIHRRVIAEGGPALLFRNPTGKKFPVVTNLFGTAERVKLAFGPQVCDFIGELARLPHELLPPTPQKLWEKRSLFKKALKVGLKRHKRGAVLDQQLAPARLTDLPALTTWSLDGGPFITLPLVYTEHPETKIHNLGMYRIQIYDDAQTGLHMQIGKGGGFHLHRAGELGRKLPVNIFVGGPPALILAAISPLPENVPELLFASLALGEKLQLVDNPLGGLPLIGEAEFALTGYADPNERRPEGPFGDHYGYYSLVHDFPVFHCERIYHRNDAIFPATVVGKPRQEDFFIGDYLQEALSPLFPVVMPAVKSLWSYGETGYHSLAAAVVQNRYKREAMVSAFRILGEGQLSLTKFLLLIDRPLELKDFRSVLTYVLERVDFRTDLYVFSNLSMDTLDYTGPTLNEGSKGVMLGMGEPIRKLPQEWQGSLPPCVKSLKVFSPGCLVISGAKYADDPELPTRLTNHAAFADWPLLILADNAEQATSSVSAFLWQTFTRFEPAADIWCRQAKLNRFHPMLEAPLLIDTRMKPNYPDELFCDEQTSDLVDKRWREYFG